MLIRRGVDKSQSFPREGKASANCSLSYFATSTHRALTYVRLTLAKVKQERTAALATSLCLRVSEDRADTKT